MISALATKVFKIPTATLQMYVDVDGSQIAWNSNGSVFCNLRYFYQCRHSKNDEGSWTFWFIIVCHELAHNGETGHNARHEHYLETLAVRYLPSLTQFLASNSSSITTHSSPTSTSSILDHGKRKREIKENGTPTKPSKPASSLPFSSPSPDLAAKKIKRAVRRRAVPRPMSSLTETGKDDLIDLTQ
eukprot:TRINITY_DN25998_c0_g1_i1.p1 TRINITY_DN25998_c0_g1~~TRINITY_DN25998_c0_g1_i1.p1  ORF type:complete len:187 (+),score=13.75 TRINITY_DN25998_c0_g1_i1:379-939(+)